MMGRENFSVFAYGCPKWRTLNDVCRDADTARCRYSQISITAAAMAALTFHGQRGPESTSIGLNDVKSEMIGVGGGGEGFASFLH
jgi:hypothetical protein